MVLSDTVNDLILFIGHCDLHIIVQQFCLISAALPDFDEFAKILGRIGQFDILEDFMLNIAPCDFYFMVQ